MISRVFAALLLGTAIITLAASARAGTASQPVKLVIEEPTFHCLGVEWWVTGDDNATVSLEYRESGEKDWRKAMALWRVEDTGQIRKVPAGQVLFAGSVFCNWGR